MKLLYMTVGACLLTAATALAGLPLIENADLEATSLQSSLSSQVGTWVEAVERTSWLGWHVPMVDRNQVLCCRGGEEIPRKDQACSLEAAHQHFVFSSARPGFSHVAENLVVLMKATEGQIVEIQVYSDGCRLDAGGREVIWLEGVNPAESVAFLGHLIETERRMKDDALMAMALHASPVAADRLVGMARQSPDPDLRGEALFWLSHSGAAMASEVILLALAEDPDAGVRDEAVFALSLLPDRQGMPLLLEILRDRSQAASVRQEALFWYVQSGDDEALDLIAEILRD